MRKADKKRLYTVSITAGAIAGTLLWEIAERLLYLASGINLNLSAGPVGFDIAVLSVYAKINPGTAIGLLVAWLTVKRLK